MTQIIKTEPLTPSAFAPYGDVGSAYEGAADMMINQGYCERYHDKASLTFDGGRAGISLFDAKPRSLPYHLDMMERHPLGSKAFLPMTQHPFLVIVAADENGRPGTPAFITAPAMGVNYHANIWQRVLTPLHALLLCGD